MMAGFQEEEVETPSLLSDMPGTGTVTHQTYSFIAQSSHKASQIRGAKRNGLQFLMEM